jgi:vacuolar protein sorting-associated protein 54
MMTDVTVIAQRLGPIAEAGKDMTKLQTLVKDKPVPRKNVSQAMAGLLKRSTSKKEAEQEEAPSAESADKDGGDEDGESLGILPEDQSNEKEETGTSDSKVDETKVSDAPAEDSTSLLSTSEKPPKVETDAASTIPPKDAVTETKKLEPDNEDAPIATEILTAPQEERELPVEPVSPVDQVHSSTDDIKVEEPPAPPLKDETGRAQNKNVDGPPETPSKEA